MLPLILIVLAIVSGGAIVGVADAAVPGDALYTIDRTVEAIQLRLTTNPYDLAEFQEALHDERLEEIQDLAVRGDQEHIQQALEALDEILATMTPEPLAEYPGPGDEEPEEQEPSEEPPVYNNTGSYCSNLETSQHPTGAKLAERYGVDYADDIMHWFCQGFGFGEIDLAYTISLATEASVEDLFALKTGGMGWGEIQAFYGLKSKDAEDDEPEETEEPEPGEEEPEEQEPSEEPPVYNNTGSYCSNLETSRHPTGAKLANRYGVDYAKGIMHWFCQGYGFGEIDLAYTISKFAKVPVEEVFALRASGMGWGEIMKYYGMGGKSGQPPGQVDKDKKVKPEKEPKVKPTKKPK
jgi:hypothetical protein